MYYESRGFMKKLLISITFFTFIIILSLFNTFAFIPYADAQDAQSNCVLTAVGNPPKNQANPCGGGNVVWPYPDPKTPSENRRVDQGWDLEYTSMGNNVRAVVDGTINLHHGTNACQGGSGFGDTYPIEVLDKPITVNGHIYKAIYYGHVAVTLPQFGPHPVAGQSTTVKVKAGQIIAKTWDCVDLGAGFIPWLEIGFENLNTDLPSGQVYSFCKIDNAGDTSKNTVAGCDMKQWLNANTK
jgi:hypothetical protein